MGSSQVCSFLLGMVGSIVGDVGVALDADGAVRVLVERTPCRFWTMCTLSILSVSGQY